MERIGALGDGGKWVCGLSRLEEKRDCVIYSLGASVPFHLLFLHLILTYPLVHSIMLYPIIFSVFAPVSLLALSLSLG